MTIQKTLHEAAFLGDLELLSILIDQGVSVNSEEHGFYPLHQACSSGKFDCAKLLIEKGHLLEPRTDRGITPLLLAVMEGREMIVQYLIQQGADLHTVCENGLGALHLSLIRGQFQVVDVLNKSGIKLELGCLWVQQWRPVFNNITSKVELVKALLNTKIRARKHHIVIQLDRILARTKPPLPKEIRDYIMTLLGSRIDQVELNVPLNIAERKGLENRSTVKEIFEMIFF
jgi:hypothetical protein